MATTILQAVCEFQTFKNSNINWFSTSTNETKFPLFSTHKKVTITLLIIAETLCTCNVKLIYLGMLLLVELFESHCNLHVCLKRLYSKVA